MGSFADHFSGHAAQYADSRPTYPAELYVWLRSETREGATALDCACGNGQATLGLAEHFGRVQAIDASAQQISHALPHPCVSYSVEEAERTAFPDHAFGLVTVAQALHWFDHPRFFVELDRLLEPGGLFAAWGYTEPELDPELDAVLRDEIGPRLAPYWPPQNLLLRNGYRDLGLPYEPVQAPAFAIRGHWSLDAALGYVRTWSAWQQAVRSEGDAFDTWAARRLTEAWGDVATVRRYAMPLVLVARRKP